jgi:hypothetical protein
MGQDGAQSRRVQPAAHAEPRKPSVSEDEELSLPAPDDGETGVPPFSAPSTFQAPRVPLRANYLAAVSCLNYDGKSGSDAAFLLRGATILTRG